MTEPEPRPLILIVDDEREIIELLQDHFEKLNCETIATADPTTVIDKLRNFSVRLMLLDLKMRKLDGIAVLDRIIEAGLALPPTMIMTGYLPRYIDELKRHGISTNDVVTKPFRFEEMENVIKRKLGQSIVCQGVRIEDKIYEKNRCVIGFVEDEPDILDVLEDIFGRRNYQVRCFSNGVMAFEALKTEPVDILLVDMKLGGRIQGNELILALSKLPNPPYMIPMSANDLPEDVEAEFHKIGCKDFISKPFYMADVMDLAEKIALERKLIG